MIEAVTRALSQPAEILLLIGLGAASLAIPLLQRRGLPLWALLTLAPIAFGALSMGVREREVSRDVVRLPVRLWASFAAETHADAFRVLWWAGTCTAAWLVIAAWTLAPVERPSRASATAWIGAAACLIAWACGAGEAGLSGVVIVAAALSIAPIDASSARVAQGRWLANLAVLLAAPSAWVGTDAWLYQSAALGTPEALATLNALSAAWIVVGSAGAVASVGALWGLRTSRSPSLALLVLGWFVVLSAAIGVRQRSLAWGPAAELAAVAAEVAGGVPAVASPSRPPGGCVVTLRPRSTTTLPRTSPRHGLSPCADRMEGSLRDPIELVWIAAAPSAPSASLLGWHEVAGDVGVLVAAVPVSGAMAAWKVGEYRVATSVAPTDGELLTGRSRPLPGSVILTARGAILPGDVEVERGPDRVEWLAEITSHAVRIDVLVTQSAAPTVGELIRWCVDATSAHPAGLRCVLVDGEPAAWRSALRSLNATEPVQSAEPDVEDHGQVPDEWEAFGE